MQLLPRQRNRARDDAGTLRPVAVARVDDQHAIVAADALEGVDQFQLADGLHAGPKLHGLDAIRRTRPRGQAEIRIEHVFRVWIALDARRLALVQHLRIGQVMGDAHFAGEGLPLCQNGE
jgi:hypothetical protein